MAHTKDNDSAARHARPPPNHLLLQPPQSPFLPASLQGQASYAFASPSPSRSEASHFKSPVELAPSTAMDGQSRPQQQDPMLSSVSAAPPMHPGPPALHEYYHHLPPPPNYPHGSMDLSTGTPGISRYPISPSHGSDQRALGGRHKKEIKRRTKTGCLTCRKRRIKCDETHPVCRNCQKSKRECEGYDPIFKQQPPPANIQPAPTAPQPSSKAHHPSPLPPPPPPPPPTAYPPHQHHPYSHIPHGYPPPAGPAYSYTLPPPVQTAYTSSSHPAYVVHHPLSPGLAHSSASTMAGTQEHAYASMHHAAPNIRHDGHADSKHDARSDSRDRKASKSPPAPSIVQTKDPSARGTFKMEQLYTIGGVEPPTPKLSKPITPEMMEEIKYFYESEYARGIDQILETDWYTTKGVDALIQDEKVCAMFGDMLELFGATKSHDYDIMRQLPSTESRMVWALMCLPRGPQETPGKEPRKTSDPPPKNLPDETESASTAVSNTAAADIPVVKETMDFNDAESVQVKHRLSIFEHLILGKRLPVNPLATPTEATSTAPSDLLNRQALFWQYLGDFATVTGTLSHHSTPQDQEALRAPTDSTDSLRANEALSRLRQLLEQLESRDVLYSIAVVRALAPKFDDFPQGFTSQPFDPEGDRERMALVVAKKFVEDEAAGKGTGQVVQRLCGMAVRGWVCGWGINR